MIRSYLKKVFVSGHSLHVLATPDWPNLGGYFCAGSAFRRYLLNRRINTLQLSFRRKPEPSGITGCRIKSGMTDFDYLIAGLI